jgi:hypothetical protein
MHARRPHHSPLTPPPRRRRRRHSDRAEAAEEAVKTATCATCGVLASKDINANSMLDELKARVLFSEARAVRSLPSLSHVMIDYPPPPYLSSRCVARPAVVAGAPRSPPFWPLGPG